MLMHVQQISVAIDQRPSCVTAQPFGQQLLKWIGNKQRFAPEIISYFPQSAGRYFEPFLGAGGVLGTLAPTNGLASDIFEPLMEIWITLKSNPKLLTQWYQKRWQQMMSGDKVAEYEQIKANYNKRPNAADLLFLCRSCYGGVVRFRKIDGFMSTPCGIHTPISPESFAQRVQAWNARVQGTEFSRMDFRDAMSLARSGDIVYCDPPYSHTQSILYGAQSFELGDLLEAIAMCKRRGAFVALSIDGSKKSGDYLCDIPLPKGLFERELAVNCGRSMLKRFQMEGKTLESEEVKDRLLLTY